MKNKHPHAAVVLVLGLAMAGLHLADLLLWSEADTGFAAAGSVWLRYIPWLAALALPYLPARRAAAQPAGLQDTCRPLGICMALTGAVLVAAGFSAVNVVIYAVQFPAFFSAGYPVWAAWVDFLLPVFCGGWLLYYAVRAFSGFGMQRQRLGRPLLAGVVPLFFLWKLLWRFQFTPASLHRLPCSLRVLSAAAALLLAVVLLKVFLVPGLPCGHTLFAAGTVVFIFSNSMQSGAASGLRSAAVTEWLNGGLARVGVGWRFSERLVRKLGHFSEYALLGFWLMLSLRVYTRRILSHISWPLFFGLLAGVLDEGIQMFADGRGSDVRDVVIDFSGVVFGLLAALFLLLLVRMFHVLRESKTPL